MNGDGLKQRGKVGGKLRFVARITGRDPATGKKVLDTERVIIATSRQDARSQRDELTKKLLAEKLGLWAEIQRIAFTAAKDEWLKTIDRAGSKGTQGSYARTIAKVFGDRPVDSITSDQVRVYLHKLTGSKPRRAGIRTVFVHVLQWAIDHGHARAPNAAREVRVTYKVTAADRLREIENPPKKHLTPAEVPAFFDALRSHDPVMVRLFVAMLSIGSRVGEGMAIKRSAVDWQTGEIKVIRGISRGEISPPKGNKGRMAAFPPSVLEMLRGHVAEMDRLKWPGHEEWLFPGRPTGRVRKHDTWPYLTLWRAVKAAKEATGIHTDNATHAIRHTTSSMIKGNVEDSVMRAVMGWASERMQDVYGSAPVFQFAEVLDKSLRQSGGEKGGEPLARNVDSPRNKGGDRL